LSYPKELQAVTAEEVLAAARKYIDLKRSVTGILLPVPGSTGAEVPEPALPATVIQ
jgi:zinc protease